jgi:hypothetical protein
MSSCSVISYAETEYSRRCPRRPRTPASRLVTVTGSSAVVDALLPCWKSCPWDGARNPSRQETKTFAASATSYVTPILGLRRR